MPSAILKRPPRIDTFMSGPGAVTDYLHRFDQINLLMICLFCLQNEELNDNNF